MEELQVSAARNDFLDIFSQKSFKYLPRNPLETVIVIAGTPAAWRFRISGLTRRRQTKQCNY